MDWKIFLKQAHLEKSARSLRGPPHGLVARKLPRSIISSNLHHLINARRKTQNEERREMLHNKRPKAVAKMVRPRQFLAGEKTLRC